MSMKLLALALSALLVPAAMAAPSDAQQTPSAAAPQQTTVDTTKRPLLWKVSDADNAVYLLGSFHLLKQDDYPLPAEVDRVFGDSASLLFEVEPSVMTSPETVSKMQTYMGYEDGKTLSAVLPKATLDKLGTLITASGGSLQAMEQSEPWAVSLGLVMGVTQAMGFRPELGMDRHLMGKAETAGKPAGGLETIDDQLKALDGSPHAEQASSLDEFLTDPKKAVQQMATLHALWRAGDAAKLDSEMRADMARKTPETYRLLDVERNDRWLPQIEARLVKEKKDNTLIVVGALHLLGSDGLVEKLKAKGYAVERICDSCATP